MHLSSLKYLFLAGVGFTACALAENGYADVPTDFVSLFNEQDLSGWKGLVDPRKKATLSAEELLKAQEEADLRMRMHWHVEYGVLAFNGGGENLCTVEDYADFELYVDWKIETAGDSGIYLRGTPQVQMWDADHEPYWKHGADKGSGGLWNNRDHARFPLAKVDKPAGEWNTFFIRMVEERVTVKLNGCLVVDNVIMENYWEPGKPIATKGPIELQSHGDKLWFRNLYVRELTDRTR